MGGRFNTYSLTVPIHRVTQSYWCGASCVGPTFVGYFIRDLTHVLDIYVSRLLRAHHGPTYFFPL